MHCWRGCKRCSHDAKWYGSSSELYRITTWSTSGHVKSHFWEYSKRIESREQIFAQPYGCGSGLPRRSVPRRGDSRIARNVRRNTGGGSTLPQSPSVTAPSQRGPSRPYGKTVKLFVGDGFPVPWWCGTMTAAGASPRPTGIPSCHPERSEGSYAVQWRLRFFVGCASSE